TFKYMFMSHYATEVCKCPLAAHNDVAYICLPNNISYTLAVFVKDFKGNESQASQYVAHISAVVYSLLMQTSVKS
ncbi:hypothetical protein KSX14_03420, partial [Phocaeicola vulgatus]|nr:hypothetical protein [Phocaeicola vulgatus]MBV3576454.1 hypothetical protein [Phocaeicola vulgatus]